MADYKDYIVRYDIQADVTKATQGLQAIAEIAQKFEGPMKTLQQTISDVSKSVYTLKENSKFVFEPKIETKAFENQLKKMVANVNTAATEMHAALFKALNGNDPAKKAMKQGVGKALASKTTQDLQKDLVAYREGIDKIMGEVNKKTKKRPIAFKDLNDENKALVRVYKQQIRETEQLLKEQEKLQQQATVAQSKTEPKKAVTTTAKAQAAKLTNVTPAVIREWKKTFGDAKNKSLTVNIRGNASGPNGALTIIAQTQNALNALKESASFSITPSLNTKAFADAEAQLTKLAGLTKAVMAPFTGTTTKKQGSSNTLAGLTEEEQKKLQLAQHNVKEWQNKIANVQRRLDANQEKYKQQPTSALKGLITRDTNKLADYQKSLATHQEEVSKIQSKVPQAVQGQQKNIKPIAIDIIGNLSSVNTNGKEFVVPIIGQITKIQSKVNEAIPVNVKIMAEQINESLRSLPRPSLTVDVVLNTNQVGKQLQEAKAKATSINKDEKKAEKKAASQTNIKRTATSATMAAMSKAGKGAAALPITQIGQETAVPVIGELTKIISKLPSEPVIPIIGQLKVSGINEQIKAIKRPTLPINMKLIWEKGAIGKQEQLKAINDKIPPITLRLDSTQAEAKLNEFINLIKSKSPQTIKFTASGTATNNIASTATSSTSTTSTKTNATATNTQVANLGKAKAQTSDWLAREQARRNVELDRMRRDAMSVFGRGLTPYEQNEWDKLFAKANAPFERYEAMKSKAVSKTLTVAQKATKFSGYDNQIAQYHAERQAMYDKLFAIKPKETDWVTRQKSKRNAELARMREDAKSAFRGLTPYEQAENQRIAKEYRAKNTADHTRRANALRAQVHNAMIPFASNQSQLNTLIKYRKFFNKAINATGIVPLQGTSAQNMLKYLQGVSQQMQNANVQIPMQLQAQINKLQAQVLKATQAANQLASATTAATKATHASKVQTVRMAKEPVSIYDRTRKWAYPFTGNTSFGARTPMAVDMAKGMGVMFAVGGAMSAVGNSFSQAVEYQNLMRTTNAILKNGTKTYTPSGFNNMERVVREVGIKTKFSAPEVASAAKFLAMAGYDINAINHSIQAIADLALIGDTDLGETADKMTNIMTTFGIKPEKMREAANIMTTTATRSNTDLMMLAESAKYGGGVANMYGYNDPNLFADTMALFGIMGNAGIQASSAGTALRMMYQNIFKPNKNQKAILDQLNKDYGISTTDSLGKFRSISDILVEMANRIPEDKMASIVGNLFRITAQPGAAATLRAAAEKDGSDAEQVSKGINAVSDFVKEKGGLSALVELMKANRASVSGNISGSVALEKQNTIHGLWAQVTSTFTEGILKAFEQNTGKFEQMLGQLRDYLAKPETVAMIQRLFDLLVDIGQVMAKFVGYWVKLYDTFPNLINQWIKWQMIFTQIGSLVTPVVAVISVLDRLRGALIAFSGISTSIGSIGAITGAINAKTITGRYIVPPNASDTYAKTKYYNARAIRRINKITEHYLPLNGLAVGASLDAIRNRIAMGGASKELIKAINLRDKHVSNIENAKAIKIAEQKQNSSLMSRLASMQMHKGGKGIVKGFGTALMAGNAVMSVSNLTSMLTSLKSTLIGLVVSLGKAIGMLFSPLTLALGAIGALGVGIYKFIQHVNGATESQVQARKQLNLDFNKSFDAESERHKNVQDFLNKNGLKSTSIGNYQEIVVDAEERRNELISSYSYLFNKDIISKDGASAKSNQDIIASLRNRYINDATMRLALGDEYETLLGTGLDSAARQINDPYGAHRAAARLMQKASILAVKNEGAKDSKILQAREQIVELRKKLGDSAQFRSQALEILHNTVNPNDFSLLGDEYITADNLGKANFDWSKLRSYALAGYNVLLKEIEGSKGSVTGTLEAIERLKRRLIISTEQFGNDMSRVVENFKTIHTICFGGKTFENIEVWIKTLPNGNLDFTNFLTQIQEKVKGFKGNIELFIEFADKVYQLLVELGIETDGSATARQKYVKKQLEARGMSDEDINKYYVPTEEDKKREAEVIRSKNNPLGFAQNINIPEMPKDTGFTWNRPGIVAGESLVEWADEQKKRTENALDNAIKKNIKDIKKGEETKTNNGTENPLNPNSTTNGISDPKDQKDYSSNYTRSAAKPTQIVFNIDKLANFDRTTIAANAEERELIAAMESRIAETVYRIFAEAANSANNMVLG